MWAHGVSGELGEETVSAVWYAARAVLPALGSHGFLYVAHLREVGPVARGESSNIICDMGFQTHDTLQTRRRVMAVKAPLAGKPGRRRRTGSPSPADLPPEC